MAAPLLEPERVARVVFSSQGLQSLDQPVLIDFVDCFKQLKRDQVGLDDVFRRRQDVRYQVLALNNPLVDRAIDLQFVQGLERPAPIHKESHGDEPDQHREAMGKFQSIEQFHGSIFRGVTVRVADGMGSRTLFQQ